MQPVLPSIVVSGPSCPDRTRGVYAAAADFGVSLRVVNDTTDAYPESQFRWRIQGEREEPMKQVDMHKVVVGSINPVKVAATAAVLCRIYGDGSSETVLVEPVAVESGVSHQPWGNEETLRGALNRAQAAQRASSATLGVGFEGGLLEVQGRVFTCAWCAVVRDDGAVGIAGGENVLLPPSVAADVRAGAELGPAMDVLTGIHNTKQGGGAIGALTGGWLDRQSAYEHLLTMALARLLTPVYYGDT